VQWFKHDSDASTDSKIKKLILKHGTDGYAIYFHCLELIAGDISSSHLTFELEHDSEIIADNLKIKGTPGTSAIDRTNEIMRDIVALGLFESCEDRIFCFKMLSRLDSSMTSSDKLRGMIVAAKKNHDTIMIPSCKNRIEENRIEKKRKERKRGELKAYGQGFPVMLSDEEMEKLRKSYDKIYIDQFIKKMSLWEPMDGKKRHKDDYMALLRWLDKDKIPMIQVKPKCSDCGSVLVDGVCHNPDCVRYK